MPAKAGRWSGALSILPTTLSRRSPFLYTLPTAPARPLRRAVLARQYAVLYEVQEAELVFVYAYSTYRNLNFLELSEPE